MYWPTGLNAALGPIVNNVQRMIFRNRDLVNNIGGTQVDAAVMTMLVQELLAILDPAGIAPDVTNNEQVIAALRRLFLPRNAVTGDHIQKVYTPGAGFSELNTLTFTPSVPGVVLVIGSINLGAPGQQPSGCEHQVSINSTIVSQDNTTGTMSNHGILNVAAGSVVQIQQTYATPQVTATGWCSTSQLLSYVFTPT